MKISATIILLAISAITFSQSSIHEFSVNDIEGNEYDLMQLKGKKVMIVNTASKCGLTPQYEDLENLYKQYKDNNFIIIGFPANNFMKQEPGTDEEIASFCSLEYGVTFPMMSKISVKGDDMHPLYQWLTNEEKNGFKDSKVMWNFQKYLIDEDGKLVNVIPPQKKPHSKEILNWLEE